MALPDANIKYLNRLINCIDPAKDAKTVFLINKIKYSLNNEIHGDFLKNDITFSLFNGNELDQNIQSVIKGVGDQKFLLKDQINSSINIQNLIRQEIIRLKFSPTNDLRLDDDLYVTFDAGPGPEKFCKDYTLILTPGSIIDSAGKDKTYKKQLEILSFTNTLNNQIINDFDLNIPLQEISFVPGKGTYTINIKTNIPGFENKEVKFNKDTFKEIDTNYFAGNATKNKYIYENYDKKGNEEINKIKYLILMKELGDTLQVAWLKDIISSGKFGLTADKSLICTQDTVVWLRSILNGVSCIFTNNNKSTFYPIAGNELQRAAADVLIKKQLINKLKTNNNGVIKSLKDFKDCLLYTDVTFHDKPILPENRIITKDIIDVLINSLQFINDDLVKSIEPIGDLDNYREKVAKSYFKSPFRVDKKLREIVHVTTFTHFLKEEMKYSFYPNLLYSFLYKGTKTITITQILGEDFVKFLNKLTEPPPTQIEETVIPSNVNPQTNLMTGGNKDKEDFKDMILKNIYNHGFLSYYTLMYLPEVLYIAYSIMYVYKFPSVDLDLCAKLFYSKNIYQIIDTFGDLNNEVFEYDPKDNKMLMEADNMFLKIYNLLIYFNKNSVPKKKSIFDLCYDKIIWMLEFINIYVKINDLHLNITEEKQHIIIDVYQDLYDAEVYITTRNMRDERSPVEFIPIIRSNNTKKANKATKAKKTYTTTRRNKGLKRINRKNKTLKRKPIIKNANRKTQRLIRDELNSKFYIPQNQVMITP